MGDCRLSPRRVKPVETASLKECIMSVVPQDDLTYQSGFGNHFSTEALPGSLPRQQNSPQRAPFGLYPEQINASAFTAPPGHNFKTWTYRILPTVSQRGFVPFQAAKGLRKYQDAPFHNQPVTPVPLRWDPVAVDKNLDFLESLTTMCGAGHHAHRTGSAIHLYGFGTSYKHRYLCFADGELLIVPQEGSLMVATEMGRLAIEPGEIVVVPRGIKFKIHGQGASHRGYVLENFGEPLRLPWRGPIGANGLANERDFLAPTAWYEPHQKIEGELIFKLDGAFFRAPLDHSPLNVVAWHGNLTPYKYDLRLFNTMNTVSFDHPDPSIFTVLTSPSTLPGTGNVDFVIFPPRWMVAQNTFRPPYFHRNIMSEYMGLIYGVYDAKPHGGFVPGGGSLHNVMTGHGPETSAFEQASHEELRPVYQANTMAFMFESSLIYRPTAWAMESCQKNYTDCWLGLKPASLPATAIR